ncbi:hypothetical protein CPB85DRAFT_1337385 [Mucidula mucida]|nr:hypothetical protein CPB85DRAFT_1337385 [Mucidula mucida]
MAGMAIARVLLFFSFTYRNTHQRAALMHWLIPEELDEDTGMWIVRPEYLGNQCTLEVIPLNLIPRGAHLLPVYGSSYLPERFDFSYSLDAFRALLIALLITIHTSF